MSRCRSCGQTIIWARSQSNDRWMPLDPMPTSEGNVTLDDGVARVRVGVDRDYELKQRGQLYFAHFVTCPQADRWRNR